MADRQVRVEDTIRASVAVWVTPGLVSIVLVIGGIMLSEMRSDIHNTAQSVATTSIRLERIDTQLTERAISDDTRRVATERRLEMLESEMKQVGHTMSGIDKRVTAVENKQR